MPVTAYKAFNSDMTCRGFQYEVGQTYKMDGDAEICSRGFHACLHPLNVLSYYPAAGSKFAVVEFPGEVEVHGADSKVCGVEISIKAELQIHEMVEAAVKHVFDAAKWTKGAASATGIRGAASATGDQGAASATGYQGAASATGIQGAASATGIRGAAMSSGWMGSVSGADGCALFLCERDDNDNIVAVWAGIAGRNGIKPNTFYRLEDGQPVEVTS